MSLGLDAGGEKIVDANYSGSHYELSAGSGVSLLLGLITDLSETRPHSFELQTLIGLKSSNKSVSNSGSVKWNRYPFEILSFYKNMDNRWRMGLGAVYQFSNELEGKDQAAGASMKFKNSLGSVIQFDYFLDDFYSASFGLKYTQISYSPESPGLNSISSNTWGMNLNLFLF